MMMKSEKIEYNDLPLDEIAKQVEAQIAQGATCYQKFTCEKCGSRQTIDEPNTFYTSGKCEECEHITDIKVKGCGYMFILGGDFK